MRKLGLIGGMGPESTIPYYHDIVYGVQNRMGYKMFPNLTIESVDVFQILELANGKKYDELTEYLLLAVQNLVNSGADFAALAANTPHIVFDRLQKLSPIPLISIVEAASNKAEQMHFTRIGLLGTMTTMKEDFFKEPFLQKNIKIVIPTEDEMKYINHKISSELEIGIVKKDTLAEFVRIVNRLKEDSGIEAIVLGCTELPLLLNDSETPVPCLDTMKIHVEALIDEIIRA